MISKMNLDVDLITFTQINSKQTIDLSGKYKTIKLPEDNIGENLDGLEYGMAFVDTPKA